MFCGQVKEFLSKNNVSFIERDVTIDKEALKELGRMGIMATPVTVIDGEVILGYDPARLKSSLSIQES